MATSNDSGDTPAKTPGFLGNFTNSFCSKAWIAKNAAFRQTLSANFELRFHQKKHLARIIDQINKGRQN
jgi:hypothetical protein